MAAGDVLKIDGARELRAALKKAGASVTELKAAHAKVAQIVADQAADRAPARSGRLRASIRGSGTNTAAIVRAGRAAVPYAAPIHWGWPRRHIRPNPFIYTAAEHTQPAWEIQYLAAIEYLIHQIERSTPGP